MTIRICSEQAAIYTQTIPPAYNLMPRYFVRYPFYKRAYQLIGIRGDLFTAVIIFGYRETLHRCGELFDLVNMPLKMQNVACPPVL